MRWLTRDATMICEHGGRVEVEFTQKLVRIEGREVLVATDPEGRDIKFCPNINPVIGLRPCKTTLKVKQGYSGFIRIDGHAVCLDTVTGLTDGTPPGIVNYKVVEPGQDLLKANA
ncbi:hypothetical protein [Sphingomonas sp. DT-204]|uniref:hypothetical protein n=1 Tax=Sphingomonas sp. DT-204 TaxID=3396166 RepID=UPI003F1A3C0F